MEREKALDLCRSNEKKVRHAGMPVGDWIAYSGTVMTVATAGLWNKHSREAAVKNGGQLFVAPYYLRYSHFSRTLLMVQLESIEEGLGEWEVIEK